MGRIIILGSSNAIPDENHENTHFLIEEGNRSILVDCASNPVLHLRRAGVDFDRITDMVLTHFHPDHVTGVPLLLMDMWLLGRKLPVEIYGLEETLSRMQQMMNLFDAQRWPDFFPINYHIVPGKEMSLVFETPALKLYASPVKHLIPTIGLRIEFVKASKVAAYSCDTEPCSQVIRLAQNADVLIHETAGASLGHTSPAQAAEVASQAKSRSLYLIHYPTRGADLLKYVEEARQNFAGPVSLAQDFMVLEFEE
jgi:ribonuclease Z